MLIDSFLAFDEIELALFRIKYLSKYVDKVVIGESNLTHSGIQKPLYFHKYFSNSKKALSRRIEIVSLDLSGYSNSWSREVASRELLIEHIFKCYPQSYFINSDLDEIPSLESLEVLQISTKTFYHFSAQTYYRYANWALQDSHQNWNKGVLGHTGEAKPQNGGRFTKFPVISSKGKGAHFSYVGRSHGSFSLKLESFAHTELNRPDLKSTRFLDFVNSYAIDHLGRSRETGFGLLKVIAQSQLDPMQNMLFEQYPHFFSFPRQLPSLYRRFLASVAITIIVHSHFQSRCVYRFVIENKRDFISIICCLLAVTVEVFVSVLFLFRRVMRRWIVPRMQFSVRLVLRGANTR